jgi:hypothetical protein
MDIPGILSHLYCVTGFESEIPLATIQKQITTSPVRLTLLAQTTNLALTSFITPGPHSLIVK